MKLGTFGSWVSLPFALVAAACTTELYVSSIDAKSTAPELGFNYGLPFVQYEVVVARLLECSSTGEASVTTTVTATPLYVRDPAQNYAIDYTTLSSWTKTSDFKLERHPNGMLKTVGAASEDRLGPIIVNVATTALKVATAAASLATGGATGILTTADAAQSPAPPPSVAGVPTCNQDFFNASQKLSNLKSTMNAAKTNLVANTTRLTALTTALTAAGGKADGATQGTLAVLAANVANSQIASDAANKAYATAKEPFVESQAFLWPPDGSTMRLDSPVAMLPKTRSVWFASSTYKDSVVFLSLQPSSAVIVAQIPEADDVKPRALLASPPLQTSAPSPGKAPVTGIRYREPARGKLIACYEARCPSGGVLGDDIKVIVDGSVPQLGRIFYLPFSNGAFQNNSLSASFAEDGTLVSAGYQEKAARGEIASDTAKQIAAALPGAIKDIRSARNDGLNAETERLKAQTNYLSAKAEYQKAIDALSVSPAEARDKERALLQSDTSLKDAYRANIEAKLALDKAIEKARAPASP